MSSGIGEFGKLKIVAACFHRVLSGMAPELRQEFQVKLKECVRGPITGVDFIDPRIIERPKKCTCGTNCAKKKLKQCCSDRYSSHDIFVDIVEIKSNCNILVADIERVVDEIFRRVITEVHMLFGQNLAQGVMPDGMKIFFDGGLKTQSQIVIDRGCRVVSVRVCNVGVLM